MRASFQQAFTVIELIFVIVIIGILSAIAVPRFADSANAAYTAKAASVVTSVMASLSAERQKRILRGDYTNITSLGESTYAFSKFSADGQGNQHDVLSPYIDKCSGSAKACWLRSGTSYTYRFADSGSADFILRNNRLECNNDAADCKKLIK